MKWSLPPRRLAASVTGLVVGLGGSLALTAPAQADVAQDNTGRIIVDCQRQTYRIDRSDVENPEPYAWRAVLRDPADTGGALLRVLWQSGDWEPEADLGTDVDALVERGWTVSGSWEVVAEVEGVPDGVIRLEYWNHQADAAGEAYGWTTDDSFPAVVWDHEAPCGQVPGYTVTEATCEAAAIIEIPDALPEELEEEAPLTYTINGEVFPPGGYELTPGSYEVVTRLTDGAKDYTKRWEFVVGEPECEEEEPVAAPLPRPTSEAEEGLPVTGTQTGIIAGAALALLTLGSGLYLVARPRRITFTP